MVDHDMVVDSACYDRLAPCQGFTISFKEPKGFCGGDSVTITDGERSLCVSLYSVVDD